MASQQIYRLIIESNKNAEKNLYLPSNVVRRPAQESAGGKSSKVQTQTKKSDDLRSSKK